MDELERELLRMLTRELGELRIMVCRSKLCSERGEMGSGRFLLGRDGSRGLEKREPGNRNGSEPTPEKLRRETGEVGKGSA